ncbi:ABC transporter permease [Oryzobacter sp. R7]|uniref:ABC transporter permease n=1 Tax=Oryzobacter faecalis TaxID=3388656 RepID=UPI00398D6347
MSGTLAGTGHLARLVLRRDRVRLPLWVAGLGGVIAASAAAVPGVYDTPAKVAGYAASVGASPVSLLMSGRQAGIDTIGGITANEISQVAQLGTCLMVTFLVVRHTRAEEESGRAELLRSTVLGRNAAAVAGLGYGVLAAALVGLVTTASMLGAGLDTTGTLAYGLGLTLLGVCYTAVALVAAQLSTSTRGALAIAGGAVAVGYLVRGLGAMRDSGVVWLSPFGWAQALDAFGEERWWPALLLVVATGLLVTVAAGLVARRDLGGGFIHPRPGRARAARSLATPIGLATRLIRGSLVGWAVGLTLLALVYGAVIPTVPDLLESNPDIGQYIGAGSDAEAAVIDAFLRYVLLFMAVLATGFGVSAVLRLRSEEESGRAEQVLATRTSRTGWMGAVLTVAVGGSVALMAVMGAGLAAGYALAGGDRSDALTVVGDQVAYAPAVLVVVAFAAIVVGLAPRFALLAWALAGASALQVLLGQTLRLPDAVQAVSPFWHLPAVPGTALDLVPGTVELLLAAALVALGLWGHRRRDLALS